MTAVLDHLAIGTPTLTDGWDLFGGVLGGTWVYGGDSPGFWWGQLGFAAGPKVEMLTPAGGPDAAFLERFLAAHGPGRASSHVRGPRPRADAGPDAGLRHRAGRSEPGQPELEGGLPAPAQRSRRCGRSTPSRPGARTRPRRASFLGPGPPARFDLIEHHVGDLDGATRLFRDVLDGQAGGAGAPPSADLTWPGGKRIRLVSSRMACRNGGRLHQVRFTRVAGAFCGQDRERAGLLAKRLGLTVGAS